MTRLIDADALLEAIDKRLGWAYPQVVADLITNAPTVEREGWVSVDLMETDDGKWDVTLKALWRRLQGRHPSAEFWDMQEIPDDEMYIFRAHFSTALLASPIKQLNTKG